MGRPLKISRALLKKAEDYLESCKDILTKKQKRVSLPKVESLCIVIGISRDTAYEWAKIGKHGFSKSKIEVDPKILPLYQQFSDILDRLNLIQVQRLIDNGLSGNYNATIVKLVLAKHGYKDESNTHHSGFVGNIDWKSCSLEQLERLKRGDDPLEVLRPEQFK